MKKNIIFGLIIVLFSDSFGQASGVKFSDMNMDGKKDILLLLQYSNDGDSWNMPVIFLQENPDNIMYLDYPNLESYKVEAKTENGNPFYRDTFLEEFLSEQLKYLWNLMTHIASIDNQKIKTCRTIFCYDKML